MNTLTIRTHLKRVLVTPDRTGQRNMRITWVKIRGWCFLTSILLGMVAFGQAAPATLNDYYRLKTSDPVAARKSLSSYLENHPTDANAQLEYSYLLINEKKYSEAATHLEAASKANPNDEKLQTQLAYVYQMKGDGPAARKQFKKTGNCQALADSATQMARFLPPPFFTDIYLNPLYLSRFDDFIFSAVARGGVALGVRGQWEIYGGIRYTDDNQSIGGVAPQILSDNAAIFSVGTRYYPFAKFPVSIFAEAGRAYDLVDQNRDRWRGDFRTGASYFDRWVPKANCDAPWRFPFKRASSLYGDLSYYSRYDDNWIGYFQWREGLRVIEKHRSTLDAFLYLGGSFDSLDVYYNNVLDLGAGATFTPDQSWPIILRYTAVRGRYIKDGPPAADRSYVDHRWEAVGYWRF